MEDDIKRWTAKRKTALILDIIQGKTTVAEASPEQNGMVERVIRTLKEQCVHRYRFETLQHASRVIGDWIGFYNHRRPHQALKMRTPAEGICFSSLTCAETAGSIQLQLA